MGTWGTGNFENDNALNYLYDLRQQLIQAIENYFINCENDEDFEEGELDFDAGDRVLLSSIDILILLSEHYHTSPIVEPKQVLEWRERFLKSYDAFKYTGAEFFAERRKVIESTFNKLEDLARENTSD